MSDLYLRADTEDDLYQSLAIAGVIRIDPLGRGEVVTDADLITVLDKQTLDDDLSCEYEGDHYVARDGQWLVLRPVVVPYPGYALDVIGTITKQVGGTEEEPIMETLPGYHANLRGASEQQATILPVIPAPANPVRVWY